MLYAILDVKKAEFLGLGTRTIKGIYSLEENTTQEMMMNIAVANGLSPKH